MDEQTYFTVQQVARRTGVTVRALHYYDQIGLLHPARVTQAGYRLYGGPELARLMQILFFRELEVPLKEIARLMAAPAYDSHRALEQHLHLLELKRKRLDRLIDLAGRALKGENTMQFDAFDTTEIQQAQAAYARQDLSPQRLGHAPGRLRHVVAPPLGHGLRHPGARQYLVHFGDAAQ